MYYDRFDCSGDAINVADTVKHLEGTYRLLEGINLLVKQHGRNKLKNKGIENITRETCNIYECGAVCELQSNWVITS